NDAVVDSAIAVEVKAELMVDGMMDRKVVKPVAVKVADDGVAEKVAIDECIASIDDKVSVCIECPTTGIVEADFVTIGGIVVEVTCHRNGGSSVECADEPWLEGEDISLAWIDHA